MRTPKKRSPRTLSFEQIEQRILLAANSPPQITSGAVAFSKYTIDNTVDETHFVVSDDFDGDGDLDVVATDYVDDKVFWYENDDAGGFTKHVLDANLKGAYPLGLGDVNGDAIVDILATGYLADTIMWYQNDGSGGFTPHVVDTTADGPHSVVVVDIDQDSDADLVVTTQVGDQVLWYENDGANNFTRRQIDTVADGAKRAEAADFDNDNDIDVVAASFFGDEIAWYENNGNEQFTKHVIDASADGAYFVSPVDIDDDGDVDVLGAVKRDDEIVLYRNNGSGGFTKQVIDTVSDDPRTVIPKDVDRDGDLDIVTASVNDDTVAWYRNDGGSFHKQIIDLDAAGAYGIFPADIDGDGDVDVLSANRDEDSVVVHYQTRVHQVSASPGEQLVIDNTLLLTTDADDGPAELTYTITAAPASELRLNGVPLSLGDTFTQDDINQNLLTYVHSGVGVDPDEFSFTVADGGECGIHPAAGTLSINFDQTGPPTTLVVDQSSDASFTYDDSGNLVESLSLGAGNNVARGMAVGIAGDVTWVVDTDDYVYVYDAAGIMLRTWKALGLGAPEGIATDGQDVWIVDRGKDRVFFFAGGATRTTDAAATSSFALQNSNSSARGIATDGTSLWVVNAAGTDKVFKYDTSGTLLGSWTIDSGNSNPRGIAVDLAHPSDIWIVDNQRDKVYQYQGAASRTSGNQAADHSFGLPNGNKSPEGIARIATSQAAGPTVTVDPLVTKDSTPGLSGGVDDPAATVSVDVAGNSYAAINNQDGTWSLLDGVVNPALTEGVYEVSVTAVDGSGNSANDTTNDELTIDLSAPVITSDVLVTNDSTPQLSGTVDDPLATIAVTVDGNSYSATNNGDGTWTLPDNTINSPLPEGVIDVALAAQDAAGNLGHDSTSDELTIDLTVPATKFLVVESAATDKTFKYDPNGNLVESHNLGKGNNAPRGVAADATGDTAWVVDGDDFIYVYDASGTLLRSWRALGVGAAEGIATDGQDVWIVDRGKDKVFFFAGGAARTTNASATSNFRLAGTNGTPRGITTDGASLWVVNSAGTDKVFKYDLSGTLLGSWTLDSANASPRGITIDFANPDDLWTVDNLTDKMYRYRGAASRIAGSQAADAAFDLDAGNRRPEGIADPPATPSETAAGLNVSPAEIWSRAAATLNQQDRPLQAADQRHFPVASDLQTDWQPLAIFPWQTASVDSCDPGLDQQRREPLQELFSELTGKDLFADELLLGRG